VGGYLNGVRLEKSSSLMYGLGSLTTPASPVSEERTSLGALASCDIRVSAVAVVAGLGVGPGANHVAHAVCVRPGNPGLVEQITELRALRCIRQGGVEPCSFPGKETVFGVSLISPRPCRSR